MEGKLPRFFYQGHNVASIAASSSRRPLPQQAQVAQAENLQDLIQQVPDPFETLLSSLDIHRLRQTARGLKDLHFKSAKAASDHTLHTLTQACPRLEALVLTGSITDDGMAYLTEFTNLKRLVMDNCQRVCGPGFRHFNNLPSVEHLEVKGQPRRTAALNDDWLEHASSLPHLGRLKFEGELTKTGLAHFPKFQSLRSLDMQCTFPKAGLQHLEAIPALEELHIALWQADPAVMLRHLSKLTNLQTLGLTLGGNNRSLNMLGALAATTGLRSLHLEMFTLDRDAKVLQQFPLLRQLELRRCGWIDEAVAQCLAKLSNLVALNLRGTEVSNSAVALLITSLAGLKTLDLSNCRGITDREVNALRDQHPHLEILRAGLLRPSRQDAPATARSFADVFAQSVRVIPEHWGQTPSQAHERPAVVSAQVTQAVDVPAAAAAPDYDHPLYHAAVLEYATQLVELHCQNAPPFAAMVAAADAELLAQGQSGPRLGLLKFAQIRANLLLPLEPAPPQLRCRPANPAQVGQHVRRLAALPVQERPLIEIGPACARARAMIIGQVDADTSMVIVKVEHEGPPTTHVFALHEFNILSVCFDTVPRSADTFLAILHSEFLQQQSYPDAAAHVQPQVAAAPRHLIRGPDAPDKSEALLEAIWSLPEHMPTQLVLLTPDLLRATLVARDGGSATLKMSSGEHYHFADTKTQLSFELAKSTDPVIANLIEALANQH